MELGKYTRDFEDALQRDDLEAADTIIQQALEMIQPVVDKIDLKYLNNIERLDQKRKARELYSAVGSLKYRIEKKNTSLLVDGWPPDMQKRSLSLEGKNVLDTIKKLLGKNKAIEFFIDRKMEWGHKYFKITDFYGYDEKESNIIIELLDKTQKVMEDKGFGYLATGRIYLRHRIEGFHRDTMAVYFELTDHIELIITKTVVVSTGVAVETLVHEFAHKLWKLELSEEDKNSFELMWKNKKKQSEFYVTHYGGTNHLEGFAELFRYYICGSINGYDDGIALIKKYTR